MQAGDLLAGVVAGDGPLEGAFGGTHRFEDDVGEDRLVAVRPHAAPHLHRPLGGRVERLGGGSVSGGAGVSEKHRHRHIQAGGDHRRQRASRFGVDGGARLRDRLQHHVRGEERRGAGVLRLSRVPVRGRPGSDAGLRRGLLGALRREPPREPRQGFDEAGPVGEELAVRVGPVDRRVGVGDAELPALQAADLHVVDGGIPQHFGVPERVLDALRLQLRPVAERRIVGRPCDRGGPAGDLVGGLLRPHPLVVPDLRGVLRVGDDVGDLVVRQRPHLHPAGARLGEAGEEQVAVRAQASLVLFGRLRPGERLTVAFVGQERLHDRVDVLEGAALAALPARPGRDFDALAPHVRGPQGEPSFDEDVLQAHDAADRRHALQAVAGELLLGHGGHLLPARLVHAPLKVGHGLLQMLDHEPLGTQRLRQFRASGPPVERLLDAGGEAHEQPPSPKNRRSRNRSGRRRPRRHRRSGPAAGRGRRRASPSRRGPGMAGRVSSCRPSTR